MMPVPPRLPRVFDQVLGAEATEDLVSWMDRQDRDREEFRSDVRGDIAELRQEMYAFRQEMHVFRQDIRLELSGMREQMALQHAALLKWSFVFWVSAVGAIAALAGVLR